jgi:hypothetical protein
MQVRMRQKNCFLPQQLARIDVRIVVIVYPPLPGRLYDNHSEALRSSAAYGEFKARRKKLQTGNSPAIAARLKFCVDLSEDSRDVSTCHLKM